MIFQGDLADLVLSGKKTETRRLFSDKPGSPWWKGGCRFRRGSRIAVQRGRTARGEGFVVLTEEPYDEPVVNVDDAAARAEGFIDRQDFLRRFMAINGPGALGGRVWVLKFEKEETR